MVSIVIAILNVIAYIIVLIHPELEGEWGMYAGAIANGEYYRLLTNMFLHFGIMHLFNNMISLLALGSILEREAGHLKILIIYVLSGIGGGMAVNFFGSEFSLHGGASGAIFGVMGAVLIFLIRKSDPRVPRAVLLIVYNVAYTFISSGISVESHVGGLITGIVLALILIRGDENGGHKSYRAWKREHPDCDDSFYYSGR